MKNFENRVAVITGAASGFGREFALIATKLGMHVVLADVQQEPLTAFAKELEQQGAQVLAMPCDVRSIRCESMGCDSWRTCFYTFDVGICKKRSTL